jgi:hypothetical protein
MALRFFGDHCVSNSTVQTLREAQREVFRFEGCLAGRLFGRHRLAKAQEVDAVLISLNGDFADINQLPAERL